MMVKVRALDSTTGMVKPLRSLRFRLWSGKCHTTFCQLTCLGNVDGNCFDRFGFGGA